MENLDKLTKKELLTIIEDLEKEKEELKLENEKLILTNKYVVNKSNEKIRIIQR